MRIVVLILGFIIFGIGIVVLISPSNLKKMIHVFLAKKWLSFATMIRILFGILFLLAASETRAPFFVLTLGILFILAGVVIPLLGTARIERLAHWWLGRSDGILRLWALFSIAFGAAILWSGL